MPEWSHPSVAKLAGGRDPRPMVTAAARALISEAMDKGWSGPPYDPFQLAGILGFSAVPSEEVPEARITAEAGKVRILFNPNKPKTRIWFSLAHEIAHTLFADWSDEARSRNAGDTTPDSWQLESLCNLAASELLMPTAAFAEIDDRATLQDLLRLQERLGVSVEALLLRFVRLTGTPSGLAIVARRENSPSIDYAAFSRAWTGVRNLRVPEGSVVDACTAIGFTATGTEDWGGSHDVAVEAIGIKGYPGDRLPRVAALLSLGRESVSPHGFSEVTGDVLQPIGGGPRIIAHVVSAAPARWGRGVGRQVASRWPAAETNVLRQIQAGAAGLGSGVLTPVGTATWVESMVAQTRLSRGAKTGILSYSALQCCLEKLAEDARRLQASVHMPMIGTGDASGQWPVIREMVRTTLEEAAISTVVYRRDDEPAREARQASLPI